MALRILFIYSEGFLYSEFPLTEVPLIACVTSVHLELQAVLVGQYSAADGGTLGRRGAGAQDSVAAQGLGGGLSQTLHGITARDQRLGTHPHRACVYVKKRRGRRE